MHEAMLFHREPGGKVRCLLCRHGCLIAEGAVGLCNVRKNEGGTLFSIFYGKPIAMALDPIEKKPLFHFRPGSTSFSIALPGCNFQCDFCQNWEISQYGRGPQERLPSREIGPQEIVAQAASHRAASIAFTYTEPTVFFEYAHDTARLARERKISSVFVTNGYMTREALDTIHPFLDAANVDLKAFRKDTYRRIMKAELDGVLDSIRYMKTLGIWVEVTTLVVPGMNDDPAELKDIARFLVETGREIPWHLSRFHPCHRRTGGRPTPLKALKEAAEIGRKAGLRYVYVGNVPGDELENTFCHGCGERLIAREGFHVKENLVTPRGQCPTCKTKVDGVGMGVPVT